MCTQTPSNRPQRTTESRASVATVSQVESAREAAPMKPLLEKKNIRERRVQRLAVYFVRASELQHVHVQV